MKHNVKALNTLFKGSFIYKGILLSLQIEDTLIKLYNSAKRHGIVRYNIDIKTLRRYIRFINIIITALITAVIIKHGTMIVLALITLYICYRLLEEKLK